MCSLTGVEEDHGLEADVLLPLQLELSHSGRGSDEHIEDLGEALDAAPLFSAVQGHTHTDTHRHTHTHTQRDTHTPTVTHQLADPKDGNEAALVSH